jgi:iron-sulfur cluster insertion protein
MITITEAAKSKIQEIISEEDNPNTRLRMFIQGGGCAGFSYGFTLDEEKNEDDFEFPAGSSSVLIDSMSAQYVQGATVDYVEDLMGASFKILNPQAQSTCGCGSSFSPY